MKIIECPSCNSQKIDFVSERLCKCTECGCCFRLETEDINDGITTDPLSKDISQANFMNLKKGEYKICPDCKNKIPVNARECPFCRYRTFGGELAIAGRGCLRRAVVGLAIIVVIGLIIYRIGSSL